MMASNSSHCESCSGEGKSIMAIRFCSDCEERLCKECVEYHRKCKATRSHHLMDLTSMLRSKIPNVKKFCEFHEDISLDFYCTQHDTVCCRKCIPSKHQSCKDVLPLEVASEHIKNSSLFEDTFSEWQNIRKTLDHLKQNLNDNVIELGKTESTICEEVKKWKNHLIKQINTFEEKIKIDLSNCKTRNLDQLKKQNAEISELYDIVQEREHELEFLKEHGSNNQLYLMLREQGKGVQDVVRLLQEMTMSYKRAHLKFEKRTELDLGSMGSISEVKEACDIQYSPVKLQQAQVQPVRVDYITTFKKETTMQLTWFISDNNLLISDLAVTADNTLFLCNCHVREHKLYVYKTNLHGLTPMSTLSLPCTPYGISILKGTDKAIVTLPGMSYVQLFNIRSLTLDKTITLGNGCYGITTSGDEIAVGKKGEIIIFKQNGENVRNIALTDISEFNHVRSLYYDHNDSRIIYRTTGLITSIQLDGSVLYQYAVSGGSGLAVDTQGNVYVSQHNKNKIQRLLPDGRFRDVVMREKDGIKDPYTIAFNENFTKFYVSNIKGLVQIYNCK